MKSSVLSWNVTALFMRIRTGRWVVVCFCRGPEVQQVARAALRAAQMLSLASVPRFTADTNPPV